MPISKNKYLFKNTAIFALGNFATKFISFFLVPMYTNILSTNEYGVLDLIGTLATVLVPFLTFNICEGVMRFSLDEDANHQRILSVAIIGLSFTTVVGLLIIPIAVFFKFQEYAVYLYFFVLSMAYSQMFLCYLRGREMLVHYSLGNILHSLSVAGINILFLVVLKRGVNGYLQASIIANSITAVYAFFAGKVYKVFCGFRIDKELALKMLKFSLVLIPNSFMWWIISSSDRIMLTTMVGATANGLFAIAYKIPTLLSTLTNVFNQAWSYSAIREQGTKDEEKYNNAVFHRLVSVVSVCATGLMLVLKPFIRLYVGAEYYIAWRYMPVLIIGFVFSTMGSFFATSYTVHKDSMGYLKSGAAGALINLILNFTLIPRYGPMGAAIATAISYIIVYFYRLHDTKKYIRYDVLKKSHIFGYCLLMAQMFTLFLETPLGYGLLMCETVLVCVAHKKFIVEVLMLIKKLSQKIFCNK